MAYWYNLSFLCVVVSLVLGGFHHSAAGSGNTQNQIRDSDGEDIYIVHVRPFPAAAANGRRFTTLYHYHQSFVSDLVSSTAAAGAESPPSPVILHSYRHVISGFAAKLTPEMVSEMSRKEGFVSAKPQKVYHLHTTHSPEFLGLLRQDGGGLWEKFGNYGKGVIIGVLDTGITPAHPSFSDEGMPSLPPKWKGKCEFNGTAAAVCNKKLIGGRNYVVNGSSVDEEGHGTHTASTAAGNFVKDASLLGNAKGTASGMAPQAHVAMYKVCGSIGCLSSAILAGIDDAIEDGVDVLSISLGGFGDLPFFEDVIAVAGFAATTKGIFVSCSAGNDGPTPQTVSNVAPWLLTVGASTIDRRIKAALVLGSKVELEGESAAQMGSALPAMPSLPLVYPGGASSSKTNATAAAFCASLNGTDVRGKVVLCDRGGDIGRVDKGKIVKAAGGVAMVLVNDKPNAYSLLADAHVLPATHLSYNDGLKVKAYINSTSSPTATIAFKGTIIGEKDAPAVASFSSRGPNIASPGILKPDIIGPGVNVLAAWPDSVIDENKIRVTNESSKTPKFNMISGTSMSCPHLSGIAALLKSAHPTWSPAAIKSAIMTTAYHDNLNGSMIADETLSPADFFAIGAGHVNPGRAIDPGLVYDLQPNDYIPYLCGLNYTDDQVHVIVNMNVSCSHFSRIPEAQLNYPSFAIQLGKTKSITYSRTVTNVGEANSEYTAKITAIPGVDVLVKPQTLVFREVNQKLSYNITFSLTSKGFNNEKQVQGAISWISKKNIVRSPIGVSLLGLTSMVNEDVGVLEVE
ncbi:unnamed protein product [Cuscuta epithymum]|uniref:Uncharacterized protein n=1 Tax=Cuscuta epithymum TaxID=186058 RepID=A0AAV0CL27_9ASTE|nr:unnamed protein product [Cuscuta epithymum]